MFFKHNDMKQEEIEQYARPIRTVFETTVLHFANGAKFHGFFEGNPVGEQSHTAQNKWNFVRYNDGKDSNVKTMVDGSEIASIEIVPRGK